MSNNQAGKGDKPRPVNKKEFNKNFDEICWNSVNKAKEQKQSKNKTTYRY